MDERALLKAYAETGDQEAFAQVVRAHGDWVYGAARRQLGDEHLAEDVTQAVFLLMARRAGRLGRYSYVGGWLVKAAQYCVGQAKRERGRRERREKEAAEMRRERRRCAGAGTGAGEASWEEVAVVLDDAVAGLRAADREMVLMRFYRQMSFVEVGQALGISEKAAQKRVERAVGKLSERLAKKGVTVEAGSLGAMVLAHAVEGGGPAGLVEKVMAGIGGGNGTAGLIAKGAEKMMVWAKVKVAAVIGFAVMLAVVAGVTTTRSSEQAVAGEMSVPALPAAVTVVGAEKEALMQDLLRLRTATRAAVVSGRGTAHLEASEEREAKLGAPNPSLPVHEVNFTFRGSESLVTGGVEFNATALLVTDSKVIRYYAGVPGHPAPAAVSIMHPESLHSFAVDLPRWSFQEISRLPRALSSNEMEPQLFAAMAKMSEARVERSGSIVRVTVEPPRHSTVLRDLRVLEFDLEHGGMLTRYHCEDSRELGGERYDSKEDVQIGWTNTNGVVLPSGRMRTWESYRSGKFSQRYVNKISFDTFTVEDVPTDQITIEHMGIAPGTPVLDEIANKEWRYEPNGGD